MYSQVPGIVDCIIEYIKWNEGFVSGSVYPRDNALTVLCTDIYKEFLWTNPLHPEIFVDIRRMEAEVVRMCVTMFHGDKDACGTAALYGLSQMIPDRSIVTELAQCYLNAYYDTPNNES
ncbi:unnamed protein product [Schistosoma margrebowiei]|uniref:Uncharacterized protein n=1 Tax=Schistosoma margrebowiei TaxID=48269 RepID=A0AA85AFR9_9TREM|nr:unnamed protein product [Schistosoma margrebowiei]